MSREYNPDKRENDSIYLLRQAEELVKLAKEYKNSSSLIYACLDCRIALEILELRKILASVDEDMRMEILEESKPRHGIEKANKSTGSLKFKYQVFMQAICELLDVDSKFFDFNKSKELKDLLSSYIHSYYMTNEDLEFDSDLMQNAITLIQNVDNFIKESLPKDDKNEEYIVLGIIIDKIPAEDKILLEDWKASKINEDMLRAELKSNLEKRNEEKK